MNVPEQEARRAEWLRAVAAADRKERRPQRLSRFSREMVAGLGFIALCTGLSCYDWRVALVVAGAILVAVRLAGVLLTSRPKGQ